MTRAQSRDNGLMSWGQKEQEWLLTGRNTQKGEKQVDLRNDN